LLAKIANDNAVMLEKCGASGFSRASSLLRQPVPGVACKPGAPPLVGASLLAKIVNDNAVMLDKCGARFCEQARSYNSRYLALPANLARQPPCRSELAREDRQR
jgi:uncharacterized metal-binding protein